MRRTTRLDVVGPWSLATSRHFWEGFAPAALPTRPPDPLASSSEEPLRTVFVADGDGTRVAASVRQEGPVAVVEVTGPGDLEAATTQVARFLALDVDATDWPGVGERDPVLAAAQRRLPGFRPCGFHSPYEAAAWAVLSQRLQIAQAARLRRELIAGHGDEGAFPAPRVLRDAVRGGLDLPGRKPDYLLAVSEAALDGTLDGAALRGLDPESAVARVRQVKGLGPFAAELVVLRGANHPDALPTAERRLTAEVDRLYGRPLAEVAEAWRPFRTWACVHPRALAEPPDRPAGRRDQASRPP